MKYCPSCTIPSNSSPCRNCGCEEEPVLYRDLQVREQINFNCPTNWADRIRQVRKEDREKIKRLFI